MSQPASEPASESAERDHTRATYDALAPVWAATTDDGPWNELLERRAVRRLLPEALAGVRVLDAGCAAGAHSRWLLDRGADVVGVDLSPAMVAEATRLAGGRGRFLVADLAEPLPLPERSFDGVLSSLALDYLEDWGPTLGELARVLRPGGWLVVSDGHPAAPWLHTHADGYFDTQLLADTWTKADVTAEVHWWHRPLAASVDALVEAGFALERIGEARPDDDFRRRFPEEWAQHGDWPSFIVFLARFRGG